MPMEEGASPASDGETRGPRLDSWKEIAVHLGRDVRTVQRWEQRERLPIHRQLHDKLGSVYAFRDELDAWRLARSRPPEDTAGETTASGSEARTGSGPRRRSC